MINKGEIVEDDTNTANGIGPGKEFLYVEISYEGTEVKSGANIRKIRR